MSERASEWFGMRVTPAQKAKIERLAAQKGSTQKAAVLEAVEHELAKEHELTEEDAIEAQPGSVLEQIDDLVGVEPDSDAPTDLSTNPKHMEDYGKD